MSTRLSTLTLSLVTATLASTSVGALAFADRAYAPGPTVRAPAASESPAPPGLMRRAPSRPLRPGRPTSPPQGDGAPPPGQHYAKPPPSGEHVSASEPEPAMDRDALRIVLRATRAKNLAAFRAYAAAGIYPSNTYADDELNVWRDRDGHLCAAATIISKSGATELVTRVTEQNNFIKLADVKQGPIEDWILTSGFTQEELVAIQKPFMGVAKKPPMPTPDPFDDADPTVDTSKRATETARLKKVYKTVDAQLVRDEAKSLDLAADRLLKHPTIAWRALGYGAEG